MQCVNIFITTQPNGKMTHCLLDDNGAGNLTMRDLSSIADSTSGPSGRGNPQWLPSW